MISHMVQICQVQYRCCVLYLVLQLTEVVFFMLVMVVFLISYGVVSQALLYPNRKPYALIFKDVLYMPYWQIYGELFLDEMRKKQNLIFKHEE